VIVLRAVRVEDNGAETETDLGEIRMSEAGAVYSHLETADGAAGGVMRSVVDRLRVRTDAVPVLRPPAKAKRRGETTH
jgi:hypothetical protein